MRIATWNVNSMKARLEKIEWWLERARARHPPDAGDQALRRRRAAHDVPEAGYQLAHHGEGRWNGVAIASAGRDRTTPITNFGDGRSGRGAGAGPPGEDSSRSAEARMVVRVASRTAIRVVSLYAPNGRVVGSPFYDGKLRWFARLARWLDETRDAGRAAASSAATSTSRRPTSTSGTPARVPRRDPRLASPSATPSAPGSTGASSTPTASSTRRPGGFTWWDYRAGNFHKNFGMRIDHLLRHRVRWRRASVAAEIDREARKGKPIPSDHAPLVLDLDEPGKAFDAGWSDAEARIVARGGIRPR